MIYKEVRLTELYPALSNEGGEPILKVYCRNNTPELDIDRLYPGILICPGGGYGFVSDREAEPVALAYLNAGINAFVLTYSVAPAKYPNALLQAAASMDYIRKTSNVTNTDPDKIAVCGFSAGGHLAASLSSLWNEQFLADRLESPCENFKPNASVLCYAVITDGTPYQTHRPSFNNLCGDDEELRHKLSLQNTAGSQNPPTFLWHTANDGCVPVGNAFLMAQTLAKAGVQYELHIFRDGPHGLSLANDFTAKLVGGENMINPAVSAWFDLSVTFLREVL